MKKLSMGVVRFLGWTIAFTMAILALSQVAFWAGIIWLNSSSGQVFLQRSLGDLMEGQDYRVEIGGFSYAFPLRTRLGKLSVFQNEDKLIHMSGLNLQFDVFPLSDNTLDIELTAKTLEIFQSSSEAVQENDDNDSAAVTPIILDGFLLPDIYFTRIKLSDISIQNMHIHGDTKISFSPSLAGNVELSDQKIVDVDLTYKGINGANAEAFPQAINFIARMNTMKSAFDLKTLTLRSDMADVDISASAVLQSDERFSAKINARPKGVEGLSPVIIDMTGHNRADFILNLAMNTAYQKKIIWLKSVLAMDGNNNLNVRDLNLNVPDITVTGALKYNLDSAVLNGQIQGDIRSLSSYADLIGRDHAIDSALFSVDLKNVSADHQDVTFSFKTDRYTNRAFDTSFQNIKLDAAIADNMATLTGLTMKDPKGGLFETKGTYNLDDQYADIVISAQEFLIEQGDIAQGVLNAQINLKGTPEKYTVSGKLAPEEINIKLPQKFVGAIPELNLETKNKKQQVSKPESFGKNIALGLEIDAPKRIFVKGWGLNAEFGGNIEVKGTVFDPKLYGDFNVIRGRLKQFGKTLELSDAKLKFSGSVPPSPILDILTETQAGDVLAKIGITGSVLDPEIKFSADPALPEDEVISHILFGESLEKISPFQAAQLAQAMHSLAGGGGGVDPVGGLQSVTGLDALDVGTDASGAATVGAGKYLTDKVYLEFETGAGDGSGNANLEVELTPNITLESEIGQDASGGAGVFWKWDY